MAVSLNDRPTTLEGTTHKMRTPCGTLYVTVNSNGDDQPTEVFCQLGKSGGCAAAWVTSMARVLSVSLQDGVPLERLQKQLIGVTCFNEENPEELGCIHQMAKALGKHLNGGEGGASGRANS